MASSPGSSTTTSSYPCRMDRGSRDVTLWLKRHYGALIRPRSLINQLILVGPRSSDFLTRTIVRPLPDTVRRIRLLVKMGGVTEPL
jgi:hypothetical protein